MWLTLMKVFSIALPLIVATGRLQAKITDDTQVEEVIVVQIGSDDEANNAPTILIRGVAHIGASPFVQLASLAIGLDDNGAGWLGIHLTEVPAPLAAQLGLDATGIMIGNVVEDSPAEEAGLRRWDVMVALNGQSVSDNMGQLIERIRGFSEGTDIDLTLIRNGEELDVEVTLGARPESAKTRWMHKFAPGVAIKERIQDRAHVLRLGVNEEFELQNLDSFPVELRKIFPFRHGLTTRIMLDDDQKSFNVIITEDDQTLAIEQDGDGEITVRRTDKDGHVTETLYDSADDLAADDEEAFDVYDSMSGDHRVFMLGDDDATFDFKFDFDMDGMEGLHELMLNLKDLKGLDELDSESLDEAMEGLHEALKNMPHSFSFGGVGPGHGADGLTFGWRSADEDEGDDSAPHVMRRFFRAHEGQGANHSFRVAPDGSIELHIRHGDTEVIQVYEDEDDLAERSPEMFEKYETTRNMLP